MNQDPAKYIITWLIITLFALPYRVCADQRPGKISIFVSIQPQVYFVERIGGDLVTVEALVLPGKNPATYAPAPNQIAMLTKSEIFFRIGVPFENSLLSKLIDMTDRIRIVDTRAGIPLRRMESGRNNTAENGGKRIAEGNDPHIWLDPLLVKKQARTIYEALSGLDTENIKKYTSNYISFIKDLDVLHTKIKQVLEPVKGSTIFVFHPSFGYFADAYGLKQVAVEIEGKLPKGRALSSFIKRAKKEKVRAVFVQPQFDNNAALKIARAIGGEVVSIDPLARNYIQNLEKMAEKVAKALTDSID